jgi:hypothetical protein
VELSGIDASEGSSFSDGDVVVEVERKFDVEIGTCHESCEMGGPSFEDAGR